MPLPLSVIDNLLGRLALRYGAEFSRQWADADPELVKLDWADALDGLSQDAIAYAIKNLPERAPHASQFRQLCRSMPVAAPTFKQLGNDVPKQPVPSKVRAKLAELRSKLTRGVV